jgi:oligopeptide/dipeptide ABC transporter ATP-binding protein
MEAPLLEAKNVTKIFGGGMFNKNVTVALENYSQQLFEAPPSITAVVGESGSGKTTLARILLGLVTPTSGQVLYRGTDLKTMNGPGWKRFRREVQVIMQDPYEVYNPFYKVDHVLTTPIEHFGLASSKAQQKTMIEEALGAVGLRFEETLGRYPHQLSGGQRQRVMVARALLLRPKVILADEPVSMIDASLRATILGSLSRLNREYGISILYITHDLTTAYQISQNIVVLYRGAVAELGDVSLVVKNPQHPYTRLLVGSIPLPDPAHQWSAEAAASGVAVTRGVGCKFADRCPSAMKRCTETEPPLYQTDSHRAVACFLYEGSSVLKTEDMGHVFVSSGTSAA